MKRQISIIFMIIFMLCFPQNVYADEIIEIDKYDSFQNFYAAIIGDTDNIQFPQTITMYTADGSMYTEEIIWDQSNINWQKEGYYEITGTISHIEQYTNVPSLSIGLALYEKYDMFLQADIKNHDSVTFSFQDSYGFKEHELDISRLHVWACEAKQYLQNQNWYDVTDYSNVHLTSTSLTIDGLDSIFETDNIYRIQISYDDPHYLKYSLITTITALDDETLYVKPLNDGDRNGGNREKRSEVIIPEKDTDLNDNQEVTDDQIQKDNESNIMKNPSENNQKQDIAVDESHQSTIIVDKNPSNDQNTDLQNQTTEKYNQEVKQSNQKNMQNLQEIFIDAQNTLQNNNSNIVEVIISSKNQTQSIPIDESYDSIALNQNDIKNDSKEDTQKQAIQTKKTVSAKNVKIYSTPSLLMLIFAFIGVIIGGIAIKKTYEEK